MFFLCHMYTDYSLLGVGCLVPALKVSVNHVIMLPSPGFSGSHSPLLTHISRIFMRSWYSRPGSRVGVMRKYWALSALHVTLTILVCTVR